MDSIFSTHHHGAYPGHHHHHKGHRGPHPGARGKPHPHKGVKGVHHHHGGASGNSHRSAGASQSDAYNVAFSNRYQFVTGGSLQLTTTRDTYGVAGAHYHTNPQIGQRRQSANRNLHEARPRLDAEGDIIHTQ